MLFNWLARANC